MRSRAVSLPLAWTFSTACLADRMQRLLGALAQIGQLARGGVDVDRVLGGRLGSMPGCVLGAARHGARCYRHKVVGVKSGPWHIDLVEETGSTNADLLARAAAGEDIDGAVLIAESQTAGRGRHGRTWSTPPRSQIALSAGVGVTGVPSDTWGWLPLLTGVAVVDAVAEVAGVAAGLKWPNDVLVGHREAGGHPRGGGRTTTGGGRRPRPERDRGAGSGRHVAGDARRGRRPHRLERRRPAASGRPDRALAWREGRRCGAGRRLPRPQPDDRPTGAAPPCPGTARWRALPSTSTIWAGCASTPAPRC